MPTAQGAAKAREAREAKMVARFEDLVGRLRLRQPFEQACADAGVSPLTVRIRWRQVRPAWHAKVQQALSEGLHAPVPDPGDLADFRQDVFGLDTPPHQQVWLQHIRARCCRRLVVITFPEAGKALALDTPIPISAGWTTMRDVRVGDELFDERGEPCRVTFATPSQQGRPCWRVTFSDRTSIIADSDHLWAVRTRFDPGDKPHRHQVTTTATLAATQDRYGRPNHSVASHDGLRLPEAGLPIPPYTLGAWLGDGASRAARITKPDPEIAENIRLEGFEVTHHPRRDRTDDWSVHGLRSLLRMAGLLGNKHIPPPYLRSSEKQRLALLQGLMDTDGSCGPRGQCEFYSSNEGLACAVLELVRSLGIRARLRSKVARFRGKTYGTAWIVAFTARADMPVFRLPRKAARQFPARPHRRARNVICSIKPVAKVPVRCIQVDSPSGLYLAGEGMVPTHNTTLFGRDYAAWLLAAERHRISVGANAPPERMAYLFGNTNRAQAVSWQLRRVLSDPQSYPALHQRWGPFRTQEAAWNERAIYMPWRDAAEKEPSVQWGGWSWTIQGTRLTKAVLDDVDTPYLGPSERRGILRIIDQVVIPRLDETGLLVYVCNRADEADVAAELIRRAELGEWHVVLQSALDEAGEPMWRRYSREHYERLRRELDNERLWNLVYLQRPTLGEMAVFEPAALEAAKVPSLGLADPFPSDFRVAALDPASDGPWAAVVVSYSRAEDCLRVLDCLAGKGGGYEAMREAVAWMMRYRPHRVAIERMGMASLMLAPEIRALVAAGHATLDEVPTTSQGLSDAYYGISALASWFARGKVAIPWTREATRTMAPLLDELAAYHPESRAPKDRVMSLWFAYRLVLTKGRGLRVSPFGRGAQTAPWIARDQRQVSFRSRGG